MECPACGHRIRSPLRWCNKCGHGKPKTKNEMISLRSQFLLVLINFQEENNRSALFNELIEMTGMERATVSKCHDNLSDMGMVEDVMMRVGNGYSKVIYIPRPQLEVVRNMVTNFAAKNLIQK